MSQNFRNNYQSGYFVQDATNTATFPVSGEKFTQAHMASLADEVEGIVYGLGAPGLRAGLSPIWGGSIALGTATSSLTTVVFGATATAVTTGSLISHDQSDWRRVTSAGNTTTVTINAAFDSEGVATAFYLHGTLAQRLPRSGNAASKPTTSAVPPDSIYISIDTQKIEYSTGTTWTQVAGVGSVPPGVIVPYGAASAPTGWLLCNAAAVSRTTYSDLFAVIGTTFGAGDGSTTFNVPDLRGIFPRGTGTHGSLTYAVGGSVAGPAIGTAQNDQIQGHWHDLNSKTGGQKQYEQSTGADNERGPSLAADKKTADPFQAETPIADAANGSPRTGTETRPFGLGVAYIIKT